MFKARVVRSHQRVFDCVILETKVEVVATARGNLLKDGQVVIGDYVQIEKVPDHDEWQIVEVDPRSSEIARVIIREQKRKVTAANCDLLVVLTAVSKPSFKRGILDRFVLRAHEWKIPAIVVFNKLDQFNDPDLDIKFEAKRFEHMDIDSFEISALNPEYQPRFLKNSFLQLQETLNNKTSLFVGQSGVGKSQLISVLTKGNVKLKSGDIGKVGKGAHTTSWSELVSYEGYTFIDSPGIRSFSVGDVLLEDLLYYFPDLGQIATECQFTNCRHEDNSKGCAFFIKYHPEKSLEGKIIHSRLESYQKIKQEVEEVPSYKKEY